MTNAKDDDVNLGTPEPGGGRYDAEVNALFHSAGKPLVAIVMVLEGDRGNGFAVCARTPRAAEFLPRMLRDMADSMEAAGPTEG